MFYRIVLVICVTASCLIGSTCGTECSSPLDEGLGIISCPGNSDQTRSYCCKIEGGFRCCDRDEFAHEEKNNKYENPLALNRHKREYPIDEGPGAGSISAMIGGIILPIACIACCCWCCSCCPCYRWCHPNAPGVTTAVTIIQPSAGYPCNPVSNNFSINLPNQPVHTGMPSMPKQDLPPQYTRGGYTNLTESTYFDSNYIQ